MQGHLPVNGTLYAVGEAQVELKTLEQNTVDRARNHLELREPGAVVSILLDLDNEVDLIMKESRRLRLEGKLNVNIYNVLIDGYSHIKEKVYELAGQYGFLKEVRSLYNFNRYAVKAVKAVKHA
jgi:hypothetical protein